MQARKAAKLARHLKDKARREADEAVAAVPLPASLMPMLPAGRQWFIAYAVPQGEARLVIELRRLGLTPYLATERQFVGIGKRRRVVDRPLFPRYVFVSTDAQALPFARIEECAACHSFLRRERAEPVSLPGDRIITLFLAERAGQFDRSHSSLRGRMTFRKGEALRIKGRHSLAGLAAELLRFDGPDRIYALVSMFGGPVRMKLALDDVEAA